MKTYYYDDTQQSRRGSLDDESFCDIDLEPEDKDAFSYADESYTDDDIWEESAKKKQGQRRKSPERVSREAQFVSLYEQYMHPAGNLSAYRTQCLLSDLFTVLCDLNRSWAYRKAKNYRLAGFRDAEGEDALIIGCTPVYAQLQADKAAGNYCTYPVAHYLRIAQNKSIDAYFRKEFGRLPPQNKKDDPQEESPAPAEETRPNRKEPVTISLESTRENSDGDFWGDRLEDASVNPFANMHRSRQERDEKSHRLFMIYLRELMDYSLEPQKPLALMYGNVLFNLAKEHGGDDPLSLMAKKTPKVNSPEWAHRRMGKASLIQLGIYSERVVRKCCGSKLAWGSAFRDHMTELSEDGRTRKWADIIYTETYTEKQTGRWVESILQSTMVKCARQLKDEAELRDYASELLGVRNKFRTTLEKYEKEACR